MNGGYAWAALALAQLLAVAHAQWTLSTKSVIAGTGTHFARQLPESLRAGQVFASAHAPTHPRSSSCEDHAPSCKQAKILTPARVHAGAHKVPDATHANLRFWFTPDSFEQDNVADDTPVETWRNVAQVGWDRSPCAADRRVRCRCLRARACGGGS